MSATALTTTNFEAAMKTHYLGAINDVTQRATVLLNKLKRNHEITGGNFTQLSILTGGNPGVGSRGEGGTLPTAKWTNHTKATFQIQTLYGRFRLEGKVARASSATAEARLAEALDVQMQSLAKDLPAEHNRMLFGDGSGILATVNSTEASTTTVFVDSTQYFKVNDLVRVLLIATGTGSGPAERSVASIGTTSITLSGTTSGTATTSAVYRSGSYGQEIWGLENTHTTTNPTATTSPTSAFGGISRSASTPYWKGNVLGNGGTNRSLTVGLMQQAVIESYKQGNGTVDFLVGHPDMWITYGTLLSPDRRFSGESMQMDGGFQMLPFNGMPFFFDKDAKNNRIYFSELSSLMMWEYEGGYQWRDANGSILQNVADKDQWEATLFKDAQFGTAHPNRMVKLADITANLG